MRPSTHEALSIGSYGSSTGIGPKHQWTAEELLSELILLVASDKSGLYGDSGSALLEQYSPDTVPTDLLESKSGLLRRLGAVLLAFVCRQKGDVLRVIADDPKQPFCLSQSFLFLSKYRPAMRDFHPETLHHVTKPLLYYLPKAQFPKGLPGFLDMEKLSNILITKEYLRIPDPAQMVIWQPFEDQISFLAEPSYQILLESASDFSIGESDVLFDPSKPAYVRPHPSSTEEKSPNSLSPQIQSAKFGSIPLKPLNVQNSSECSIKKESEDNSLSSSPHRIKCFQFFKKTPQVTEKVVRTTHDSGLSNILNTKTIATEFRLKSKPANNSKSPHRNASGWRVSIGRAVSTEGRTPKTPVLQEVTNWVTAKDFTYFTTKTQLMSGPEPTFTLDGGYSSTDSVPRGSGFSLKPKTPAAIHDSPTKGGFADVAGNFRTQSVIRTNRIVGYPGFVRGSIRPRELTEVIENDHEAMGEVSKSELSISNRLSKQVKHREGLAKTADLNLGCTSGTNSSPSKSTKETQSHLKGYLQTRLKASEPTSSSVFASTSKPSLATPTEGTRKYPSTSIERQSFMQTVSNISRRTPVSLQDCDQMENTRTRPQPRTTGKQAGSLSVFAVNVSAGRPTHARRSVESHKGRTVAAGDRMHTHQTSAGRSSFATRTRQTLSPVH